MTAAEQTEYAWLARIRHYQGRKGEVLAEILTDFPEKFSDRRDLALLTANGKYLRNATLTNHWPHKGQIVLHFEGVNSINDAETLDGLIVAIPATARTPLGEDEAYVGDLIGCQLIDVATGEEKSLGEIVDVDRNSGPIALLVVEPANFVPDGKQEELLIPFAKAFLKQLDVANRRVVMTLPEGLAELNN